MGSDRASAKILAGFLKSTDVIVEEGKSVIIDAVLVNNQNGFFGQFFKLYTTKGEQLIDLYLPPGDTVTLFNSFIADFGAVVKAGHNLVSYTILYKGSG